MKICNASTVMILIFSEQTALTVPLWSTLCAIPSASLGQIYLSLNFYGNNGKNFGV